MAAAAAVLLPELSMSTSQGPDVSIARHRRRQTNRRTGTLKILKQNELEDSTLKLSHLNPHPPGHNDSGFTPNTQSTETKFTNSITTPNTTENGKSLGETARQRRSRTKRKDPRTVTTPHPTDVSHFMVASHGQFDLEDSTAGVASLLQKKLSQSDLEQSLYSQSNQTDGGTVISNPAASLALHERRHDPPVSGTITPMSQQGDGEHSAEHDGDTVIERPLPCLDPANQATNDLEVLNEPVNTNEIMGITIHGCDALRASVHISHPCVRVSIIDTSETVCGSYAKKSHREKCVMSFYERGNPAVDYIMPILTQPFESKDNGNSLLPMWEETLIFNEHPTHFTANENLVIFFEILDFSTAKRTNQSQVGTNPSPWYKVAWAFACPAGKLGKANMGEKCRLQLHRYPKRLWRRTTTDEEVFDLWARNYRVNYPSTLYVTLKVVPFEQIDHVPTSLQPNRRSMLPTQREEGSVTYEQLLLRQQATKSSSNLLTQSAMFSASARLPNQACHIPSTLHATVHPTKMGCSTLAFSHSGTLLAAGCADQDVNYPMVIFEVPSFKPLLVTEGHRGIIYNVCWKQDDKLLASASADGLVKLWSLETIVPEPVATLPHPCYVYSVCFASGGLIFTGAYDSNIRVWSISNGSPQLLSELRGCSGLVNCFVWSRKDKLLYSGDSKGRVCVWKENEGEWSIQRIISAVNNGALTSMSLHPNGRKLLLHTDRGRLFMVDLRIDRVCCEYKGLLVSQSQRFSSLLSPCGDLLFAGGANGEVHVWNSDSGKHLHNYSDLPFKHCAMCAMDFHPNEHMLVLSAFGTHEPIVVLTHLIQYGTVDKNAAMTSHTEGGGVALMPQNSTQLRATQRLTEATKTLNGVTISKRSKRKQNQ